MILGDDKMKNKLREYEELLTKKNFKLTSQRRLILQTLLDNISNHPTAEEIYQMVRAKNSRIGLATVYRTLELLCDLGILNELSFDNNGRRYELEQEDSHHHHLICLQCQKIIEFTDDMLNDLEKHVQKKYNFAVVDHHIKFYGYCEDCQES